MSKTDEPAKQPTFATDTDRDSWLKDINSFGMAIVDANGKHVDLNTELARIRPKRN